MPVLTGADFYDYIGFRFTNLCNTTDIDFQNKPIDILCQKQFTSSTQYQQLIILKLANFLKIFSGFNNCKMPGECFDSKSIVLPERDIFLNLHAGTQNK